MAEAVKAGIPEFLEAAQRSPVYKLIDWKLALPPHPEFRTLPNGLVHPTFRVRWLAGDQEPEADDLERLRIPLQYRQFTGGRRCGLGQTGLATPPGPAALYEVGERGRAPDVAALEAVGLTAAMASELSPSGLADYHDRFVVAHRQERED